MTREELTPEQAQEWLETLKERGLITRYEVEAWRTDASEEEHRCVAILLPTEELIELKPPLYPDEPWDFDGHLVHFVALVASVLGVPPPWEDEPLILSEGVTYIKGVAPAPGEIIGAETGAACLPPNPPPREWEDVTAKRFAEVSAMHAERGRIRGGPIPGYRFRKGTRPPNPPTSAPPRREPPK